MPANRREYARAHYEANKEVYLARARASNAKKLKRYREIVRKAKSAPCADCNISYPYYVMQFDHIGPEKNFNVGDCFAWKFSEKRLLAEMALCEVVCANCHMERTHQRRVAGSGVEPPPAAL